MTSKGCDHSIIVLILMYYRRPVSHNSTVQFRTQLPYLNILTIPVQVPQSLLQVRRPLGY